MNTAHRKASRAKHQPVVLPKWFRPRADADQQLRCKVIHWDLIDRFTKGQANKQDMLDWIANAFTYSRMMLLLAEDGLEFSQEAFLVLAEQIEAIPAVMDRYRATGRVGFNGTELQIARAAAHTQDSLIELDRHGIADQAARWSVDQMSRIVVGPAVGDH